MVEPRRGSMDRTREQNIPRSLEQSELELTALTDEVSPTVPTMSETRDGGPQPVPDEPAEEKEPEIDESPTEPRPTE
jgi:hypothetical protein